MRKIIYICLCLLFPLGGLGRLYAQNTFANVELSRRSVYVQQPFKVTVTLYTTTWFSAPPEFNDPQIPNSFVLSFSRTTPGVFYIDGKQYSGIQFYYIVFPYKAGDFIIPTISVTAATPPEGSATPRKITVNTPEQSFAVRDVPDRLKQNGDWFVAKDVDLRQGWSTPVDKVKVGDVVKRIVTVDAKGTLPQFIPDLTLQEKVDWASTYPQSPELKDMRDDNDANGRSTQTITYLFEKEGDFTIPPITVSWWNPYTNQMYVKSTEALKVHVAANPHLGILTTLRDSLQATQPLKTKPEPHSPLMILGLHWYTFAAFVVLALFLLYYLQRLLILLYHYLRNRHLQAMAYKKKQKEDAANPLISETQKPWN